MMKAELKIMRQYISIEMLSLFNLIRNLKKDLSYKKLMMFLLF